MLKFWPFQSPDEVVVAGPAAVGLKLDTIRQSAPGLTVPPWPPGKPEKAHPAPPPAPDIRTVLGPMLVTVTVWLGELVPIGTEPKSRLAGEMRNCCTPSALSVMLKFWPFQSPDEVVLAAPAEVGEKL